MAYGLKYQTQFTSQSDVNTPEKSYTIQFLFKNYTGGVSSVICGSTPVLHKYGVDEPFAPIKGSNVEITLLNTGALPLTSFYADEDDGVQVILLEGTNVLFIGLLCKRTVTKQW